MVSLDKNRKIDLFLNIITD